jgi:hypothetical protein
LRIENRIQRAMCSDPGGFSPPPGEGNFNKQRDQTARYRAELSPGRATAQVAEL